MREGPVHRECALHVVADRAGAHPRLCHAGFSSGPLAQRSAAPWTLTRGMTPTVSSKRWTHTGTTRA